MEPKFQTSFIPKKPLASMTGVSAAPVHHRGTSFYMGFAVILFVLSMAAAGGAFAWQKILVSSQEGYKQQLAEGQKQFNPDLIQELKETNVKIDMGRQLLQNHTAASALFNMIGRITVENVRFLNLDFTAPKSSGEDIKITLNGYGNSFSAVAYQSDVLNQLEQYGLRRVVKNPIISDPTQDTNGTVSFGFTASIDPAGLSYEKLVGDSSATSTSP